MGEVKMCAEEECLDGGGGEKVGWRRRAKEWVGLRSRVRRTWMDTG